MNNLIIMRKMHACITPLLSAFFAEKGIFTSRWRVTLAASIMRCVWALSCWVFHSESWSGRGIALERRTDRLSQVGGGSWRFYSGRRRARQSADARSKNRESTICRPGRAERLDFPFPSLSRRCWKLALFISISHSNLVRDRLFR